MLETFVHLWALRGAVLIDGIAAILVLIAVLRATSQALLSLVRAERTESLLLVRRRLSEWLVFSLELLIGSDIIHTAVAPSWQALGQLGAIVVLRVVIDYTLLQSLKESRNEGR
ncbi:MAG: DUF1622 domain-containing protein [Candidatus Baltobacteraceae bacterium]